MIPKPTQAFDQYGLWPLTLSILLFPLRRAARAIGYRSQYGPNCFEGGYAVLIECHLPSRSSWLGAVYTELIF